MGYKGRGRPDSTIAATEESEWAIVETSVNPGAGIGRIKPASGKFPGAGTLRPGLASTAAGQQVAPLPQQAGRQQTILAAYRLCLAGSLTHPHDVYMEDYERVPSAYTLVYETGQWARPRH